MSRYICLAILMFSFEAWSDESKSPIDPIEALFDGMRAGSAEQILSAFTDGATLSRAQADGTMKAPMTAAAFADAIGKYDAGYIDEQIFDVEIQQYETLASAWAPFKIFAGGELVGCGVNHFRLIKTDRGWKIADLVDFSKAPEKC